jgi:TetR/AcrR family transcriptional regulator
MPKKRSDDTKPQRRDPAATRKKLLTAARREFASSGLAGARVERSRRAGAGRTRLIITSATRTRCIWRCWNVYEEIRAQSASSTRGIAARAGESKKPIESSLDHPAAHPDSHRALTKTRRRGARRGLRKLKVMTAAGHLVSTILGDGVGAGIP